MTSTLMTINHLHMQVAMQDASKALSLLHLSLRKQAKNQAEGLIIHKKDLERRQEKKEHKYHRRHDEGLKHFV